MSGKSVRVFVDTNILVYAHDRSAGVKQAEAKELITSLWQTGGACVSVQVLQEFYVAVTRKVPQPLDWRDACQIVSSLAEWNVHVPEANDVLRAIEIQQQYGLSFWDAMVIRSAQQLRCCVLVSEDLNHGQRYDTLRVENPFVSRGLRSSETTF